MNITMFKTVLKKFTTIAISLKYLSNSINILSDLSITFNDLDGKNTGQVKAFLLLSEFAPPLLFALQATTSFVEQSPTAVPESEFMTVTLSVIIE